MTHHRERCVAHPIIRCILGATGPSSWIGSLDSVTLPLTGLVIRNEVPVGLYEGFSPLAVQLFAREFGVDFDPVRMFNDDRAVLATDSESGVHLPAVFWKWAGWKARERYRIIQSLVQTLRVRLPHLEFGITLQPQSVTAPVRGLIHFAEDWGDVARGPFDMFVIRIDGSDPAVVHPTCSRFAPGIFRKQRWCYRCRGDGPTSRQA